MKNEKKFGKNHEYFHERIHVMRDMTNVHLDNAKKAHHYFESSAGNVD
jgi:hypothetical protein